MQTFMILSILFFSAPANAQSTTGDDKFGLLTSLMQFMEEMLEMLIAPLQIVISIMSQPADNAKPETVTDTSVDDAAAAAAEAAGKAKEAADAAVKAAAESKAAADAVNVKGVTDAADKVVEKTNAAAAAAARAAGKPKYQTEATTKYKDAANAAVTAANEFKVAADAIVPGDQGAKGAKNATNKVVEKINAAAAAAATAVNKAKALADANAKVMQNTGR